MGSNPEIRYPHKKSFFLQKKKEKGKAQPCLDRQREHASPWLSGMRFCAAHFLLSRYGIPLPPKVTDHAPIRKQLVICLGLSKAWAMVSLFRSVSSCNCCLSGLTAKADRDKRTVVEKSTSLIVQFFATRQPTRWRLASLHDVLRIHINH
jgi:hypothetical protein